MEVEMEFVPTWKPQISHTKFCGFIQDLSIFLPHIWCLFIELKVLHLREYLSYYLLVFKLVLSE